MVKERAPSDRPSTASARVSHTALSPEPVPAAAAPPRSPARVSHVALSPEPDPTSGLPSPARVSHTALSPEPAPTPEPRLEPTPRSEPATPRPWRLAFDEWNEHTERHGFDPDARRVAEQVALDAIAALPIGDPDYVEARCLMALPSVGGTAEQLWLEALDELRRTPEPDPERRFRHLDRRPLLVTELSWSPESLPEIEGNSLRIGSDPAWCADADEAFVRLELAGTYFSYAMVKGGLGLPLGTPVPSRTDAGRAATETFVALFDDVEEAVGRKHRYMASLAELGALECWDGHRRKHPRQCMSFGAAVRKALRIRHAALPSDDPALHGSQLRVAVLELKRGRRAKAVALLEQAIAGRLEDEAHVTAAALLGGILVGDGEVDAGLRSLARAADASDRVLADDQWTHQKTLEVAQGFFAHAGRDDEARDYMRRAQQVYDR